MNILYFSALEGGKYTGPINSVPKRIIGQKKYDNVFWVNLTDIENGELFDNNFYHYIPPKKFDFIKLPQPFNKPDLIIFEEFFKLEFLLVAQKARKNKIPYIIVPRCQMTENYLKNKYLKKVLASKLLFNHFAENALAVQFLTEQEKRDSKSYYLGKSFIAPNGISLRDESANMMEETITGAFIGRYSIWQKGLDLLFSAIEKDKTLLKDKGIVFNLYGPNDRTGSAEAVKKIIDKKDLNDLVHVNGPIFDDGKREVLLNSSFFVHTSRFEGMPMAVLEALSYGVPCLVTQGSNVREEVQKYNAGWGADNTVESIMQALEELCKSIDTLKEKGCNAKNLAKNYSWDSISIMCHSVYSNLIIDKGNG